MLNLSGGELMLLIVLALVILGPDKLPGYAAKLGQFVRSARDMAEGAKTHIREEMGPGFDDVDWSALDPRQYDPRRIVREALSPESTVAAPRESASARAANEAAIAGGRAPRPRAQAFDPSVPTPWDPDAT
ncbi:twin-arginine translocase TatA/TatE family subunit [Ornithinimicrobium cavernae]|uniref:twin-arginine translocase TatA/TatE family subunit n=1 Tax=Ornithinimicrobium cavernae TaxID=2666047 RepID=UPI001F332511|nr:twin-arginine translocase TatA/TatE family subunit [Ornithinimicrobium cavernae]